jgi:predicted nucleic acid-binding protein
LRFPGAFPEIPPKTLLTAGASCRNSPQTTPVVPEIWAFEIANSIFVSYSKRKRITEAQIQEYLALLKALPIRVEPQALCASVGLESLARRRNLAAYDAAYLDLAKRTGLPIATADEPLRQAAIAEGIAIIG